MTTKKEFSCGEVCYPAWSGKTYKWAFCPFMSRDQSPPPSHLSRIECQGRGPWHPVLLPVPCLSQHHSQLYSTSFPPALTQLSPPRPARFFTVKNSIYVPIYKHTIHKIPYTFQHYILSSTNISHNYQKTIPPTSPSAPLPHSNPLFFSSLRSSYFLPLLYCFLDDSTFFFFSFSQCFWKIFKLSSSSPAPISSHYHLYKVNIYIYIYI